VVTYSKIAFFSITITLACLLYSCNKKNDVIPDVYVDFTIDLHDPEFSSLISMGITDTVDSRTNNWGYRSSGYDYNGIIIYSGVDEYYAYDRTCPHDYISNGTSIKVLIDKSNTTCAKCPVCKTTYALYGGGVPVSGPGRYPLKNYRTSFDGRYIRVWNK
jgi:nitrite reductase/ring-hydroxylating ferredoxin subunit